MGDGGGRDGRDEAPTVNEPAGGRTERWDDENEAEGVRNGMPLVGGGGDDVGDEVGARRLRDCEDDDDDRAGAVAPSASSICIAGDDCTFAASRNRFCNTALLVLYGVIDTPFISTSAAAEEKEDDEDGIGDGESLSSLLIAVAWLSGKSSPSSLSPLFFSSFSSSSLTLPTIVVAAARARLM